MNRVIDILSEENMTLEDLKIFDIYWDYIRDNYKEDDMIDPLEIHFQVSEIEDDDFLAPFFDIFNRLLVCSSTETLFEDYKVCYKTRVERLLREVEIYKKKKEDKENKRIKIRERTKRYFDIVIICSRSTSDT